MSEEAFDFKILSWGSRKRQASWETEKGRIKSTGKRLEN